jgi:hypothetical protein
LGPQHLLFAVGCQLQTELCSAFQGGADRAPLLKPCRFYFLSNDELLEILSEAKDPLAVQPFVKKCFEAVKELVFEANGEISAMISQEGEKITFTERVNPATSGVHVV